MLIGEYQHNIDPKGRLTIPSKFREDLGDRFYVTKGMDNCLFVMSVSEWEKLSEKLNALEFSRGRGIRRHFFAGAAELEPDKQGRVLIPQSLKDYAGLTGDCTVIGSGKHAEIWDAAAWRSYEEAQTDEVIEATMELLEF